MKTALLIFALCLSASAQVVTLLWDDNTETNVIGYRVYHGNVSRQYSRVTDVGDITFAEIAVTGATYFAVTAYDSAGLESGYSDEVSYVPPSGNTLFISGISAVMLTSTSAPPVSFTPLPGYLFTAEFRRELGGPVVARASVFVEEGGNGFVRVSAIGTNAVPKSGSFTTVKRVTAAQLSPVPTLQKRAPAVPKRGKL